LHSRVTLHHQLLWLQRLTAFGILKIFTRKEHVKLIRIAADLLCTAGEVSGIPSPVIKPASLYHKIGFKWYKSGKFDLDLFSKFDLAVVSEA
jgi:hypothetical protein